MEVMRFKPTRAQILAAANRQVPDILGPELKVLFCGTNPGLYSAAIGRHFGRPGNRFWPALFAGGFTPRQFCPFEDESLLDLGYGLTNIRERATAAADELTATELQAAAKRLTVKVEQHQPRYLAVIGVGAYRIAFRRPRAQLGPQPERIGSTAIWILPSTSGLNAHYQPAALARLFRELHDAVESR